MRSFSSSSSAGRRVHFGLALLACLAATLVATAGPAGAAVFSNSTPITVPDAICVPPTPAPATPYPSSISVAGEVGTISDLNVTLHNVTSDYGGDLEVLLVSPSGGTSNLRLLSDAGQAPSGVVTNVTLVFDDEASSMLAQNGEIGPANSTLTVKPTNHTELSNDTFPAPAPAPSANSTLAAFDGLSPNGTWSLYVIDDACGDGADTIGGGWSLDVTTSSGAATTTTVASSPNPSTTGQTVTFTATVTSTSTVNSGTVTFTEGVTALAANVPVNSSGQAAFTTSSLTEGNHIIKATYNGTASLATSNGSVNHRVNNATVVTGNQYCNPGPVAVRALPNPAVPYPSNIFVSGAATNLGDVNLTLKNVSHEFPDDMDVLLVGPAGQNLVVLSDAGNPGASNVTVAFDDAAAGQLPQNASWAPPNTTITSRPVDYDPAAQVYVFAAPAPAPSPATALSAFNGTNPNGTWSLYVVSDGAPETGTIAGGWCLTLTGVVPVTPTLATQVTPVTGAAVTGDSVFDTATVTGVAAGPAPTGSVTFTRYFDAPGGVPCSGPSTVLGPVSLTPVNPPTSPQSSTATSAAVAAGAPGTFRFTASYSGDANYNPVGPTSCGEANENVTVQGIPSIATATTPAGTAVIGTPVFDTATVTGSANGPVPTGTVTFTRFVDPPGAPPCSGPSTTEAGVALTPGPVVIPPTPPTASATSTAGLATGVGTIRFVVSYSGDANYAAVGDTACGAPNENVTVTVPTSPDMNLTCVPSTNGLGDPVNVCTAADSDGVRTVLVVDTATNTQAIPPASFSCPAGTTTQFTVPANARYKVFLTDCNTPRVKSTFVIRVNGTVNKV